jgi:hypothetical protein
VTVVFLQRLLGIAKLKIRATQGVVIRPVIGVGADRALIRGEGLGLLSPSAIGIAQSAVSLVGIWRERQRCLELA